MCAGARVRGVLSPAARGCGQALDGAAAARPSFCRFWRPSWRRRCRPRTPTRTPSSGATVSGDTWPRSIGNRRAAPCRRRTRCCWPRSCSHRCATRWIPIRSGWATSDRSWRRPLRPMAERLKASRRDTELARQMLLAMRYVLPSQRPNRRRPRLARRDFLDDALRLAELVSDAETTDATLAGQPDHPPGAAPDALADAQIGEDELPPELESTLEGGRRGRGRERRGRGDRQDSGSGAHGAQRGRRPGRRRTRHRPRVARGAARGIARVAGAAPTGVPGCRDLRRPLGRHRRLNRGPARSAAYRVGSATPAA